MSRLDRRLKALEAHADAAANAPLLLVLLGADYAKNGTASHVRIGEAEVSVPDGSDALEFARAYSATHRPGARLLVVEFVGSGSHAGESSPASH